MKRHDWKAASAAGWGIELDPATGWWWITGPDGLRREARRSEGAAREDGTVLWAESTESTRTYASTTCTDPAVQAQAPEGAEILIYATNFPFEIPGQPGTKCRRVAAWAVQNGDGTWSGMVGFVAEPSNRVVDYEKTGELRPPPAMYTEDDAFADACRGANKLLHSCSRETDALDESSLRGTGGRRR